MKVYIDGRDKIGWHVDVERKNIQASFKRLNITEESAFWRADIVHNIWWNSVLDVKKLLLRFKKNVLVTASNFINLEDEHFSLQKEFEKVKKIAKGWIVPSTKQKKILDSHGLRTYYQPFYLDLSLFKPVRGKDGRKELLERFSIPREKTEGKIILGSFQRDSLGRDLTSPKWQKGPDLLIEILRDMPRDNFVLLLAGPRRHYLINQCMKHGIPYHFIGNETDGDDIHVNTLDISEMPHLYSLVDVYLVTSVSEGGPKAVMEASAIKTFIFTTDVGLAADFINSDNVFRSIEDYKKAIFDVLNDYERNFPKIQKDIEDQYERSLNILGYDKMDRRLMDIYKDILSR